LATTELEIFQLALTYVGSRGEAETGSEERRVLDLINPEVKGQLSAAHNWNALKKTEQLVQVAPAVDGSDVPWPETATTSAFVPHEWSFAYAIPSTLVIARKIFGLGRNRRREIPFMRGVHLYDSAGVIANATHQPVLFCDELDPYMEFTRLITPGATAWLDDLWALTLAARVSVPLEGKPGQISRGLAERAQAAFYVGIAIDAQEAGRDAPLKAHSIAARA